MKADKNHQSPDYRPDIDGLRGVAVLGVVFFHAALGIPGGYVGVDVFFVISGFLITSLILKDLRRGTFSMVGFWERRVRRIFPALAVMVVACLVAGAFLFLPFSFLVLSQSVIALVAFTSNIFFWRTTGYFSPAAEENPLLHTWSLSVEEQFYLVVPIMLAALFRWKREKLLPLAIVIGLFASFALSVHWTRLDPAGAFYLLPSRGWELALGSLVTLASPIGRSVLRELLGLVGILGLLFAFVFYEASTPFPGLAALPPAVGSALLIWSGIRGAHDLKLTHVQRFLACGPLLWVGLLSYSFYLWHWPFFAFHRCLFGQSPDRGWSILYVLVALVASMGSLRFVERPFRSRTVAASRKGVFAFFGIATSSILLCSIFIYRAGGLPARIPPEALRFDRVEGNESFTGRAMHREGFTQLGVEGRPKRILVWGDSHASVLLGAMDVICQEKDIAGVAAVRGGTPPVFGWSGCRTTTGEHVERVNFGNDVRALIKTVFATGELKHVFLIFRWSYYIPREPPLQPSNPPEDGFADALIATVGEFQRLGLRVSILQEVPIFPTHVARSVALHYWRGRLLPHLTSSQYGAYGISYRQIINRLRTETPEVELIDPLPYLLSEQGSVEYVDSDGTLLYRDQHHLTKRGSMRLLPAFRKVISGLDEKMEKSTE